jgi:hypothetical protein
LSTFPSRLSTGYPQDAWYASDAVIGESDNQPLIAIVLIAPGFFPCSLGKTAITRFDPGQRAQLFHTISLRSRDQLLGYVGSTLLFIDATEPLVNEPYPAVTTCHFAVCASGIVRVQQRPG